MPQNIRVAVLGEGEYFTRLIRAILDKQIVEPQSLRLESKNTAAHQAAGEDGVTWCEDAATAILKSEIVLLCTSRKEMSTALAPISQCMPKCILVTVCDDARVDLNYVAERVVNGTEIITATLNKAEDGRLSVSYNIGKNVRLFLHQSCRDLVNALCDA